MSYFIEVGYDQLTKKHEEVCGDQVEVVRMDDGVIVVLSDGLGSGIKANILATLTVKIAATMIKNGGNLSDVLDTITNTLPVCKIRDIAYATFTILYVKNNGNTYIAEFDNPTVFYYACKENKLTRLDGDITTINANRIKEIKCQLKEGDTIVATTDGVIHAGVGEILNFGWEWHHVAKYLQGKCANKRNNAMMISKYLVGTCYDLYNGQASDDVTALTIKMKTPEITNVFTGPPLTKENDAAIVKHFFSSPGKRIICGGTAANITARELKRDIHMDISTLTEKIPPISKMRGFELITEGVITIKYALEYMKEYANNPLTNDILDRLKDNNGASILANILLNKSTHINFYLGRSLNAAHRNHDMPSKIGEKFRNVGEMINILRKQGKIINIYYY